MDQMKVNKWNYEWYEDVKDNYEILNACARKGILVVKVVDINRRKTVKIYVINYVNIFMSKLA